MSLFKHIVRRNPLIAAEIIFVAGYLLAVSHFVAADVWNWDTGKLDDLISAALGPLGILTSAAAVHVLIWAQITKSVPNEAAQKTERGER